ALVLRTAAYEGAAVRLPHELHARREIGEGEEVAVDLREAVDQLRRDRRAHGAALEQLDLGTGDDDLLDTRVGAALHREVDGRRLTDAQRELLRLEGGLSDRHPVLAGAQVDHGVAAVTAGRGTPDLARRQVDGHHRDAGTRSLRAQDAAAHGGTFELGPRHPGREGQREQQEEEAANGARSGEPALSRAHDSLLPSFTPAP